MPSRLGYPTALQLCESSLLRLQLVELLDVVQRDETPLIARTDAVVKSAQLWRVMNTTSRVLIEHWGGLYTSTSDLEDILQSPERRQPAATENISSLDSIHGLEATQPPMTFSPGRGGPAAGASNVPILHRYKVEWH